MPKIIEIGRRSTKLLQKQIEINHLLIDTIPTGRVIVTKFCFVERFVGPFF